MAAADLVITGTVLTVDDTRPTVEALAVADGRIVAVGDRSEMADFTGPTTQTLNIGDGCVMPGFIEAHGHPLMEAIALSDRLVDIRPVTMRNADDVVEAVRSEVKRRGPDGAYLLGWDALLQPGLPEPTLTWLDDIAPDDPLVIIHNSGHKAFFNSCAA
ncbi:MAG TPA: amidohydrolase family protein, partial [Mycobacterium sp.]|uniref:amidohydrolase family protein n=1 Tax=Mycobacterium sp. TaxID=1785 RepID=UPI002BF5CBAC